MINMINIYNSIIILIKIIFYKKLLKMQIYKVLPILIDLSLLKNRFFNIKN